MSKDKDKHKKKEPGFLDRVLHPHEKELEDEAEVNPSEPDLPIETKSKKSSPKQVGSGDKHHHKKFDKFK